jgi:hypothetical protein
MWIGDIQAHVRRAGGSQRLYESLQPGVSGVRLYSVPPSSNGADFIWSAGVVGEIKLSDKLPFTRGG